VAPGLRTGRHAISGRLGFASGLGCPDNGRVARRPKRTCACFDQAPRGLRPWQSRCCPLSSPTRADLPWGAQAFEGRTKALVGGRWRRSGDRGGVGEGAVDQITEHARPNAGLERDALTMWQNLRLVAAAREEARASAELVAAATAQAKSSEAQAAASSRRWTRQRRIANLSSGRSLPSLSSLASRLTSIG